MVLNAKNVEVFVVCFVESFAAKVQMFTIR